MIGYVARRLVLLLPTLLGISLLVFLTTFFIPGDPARLMLGERASADAVAELRQELGLDRPFYVQYGLYLGGLLQGDMGRSLKTRESIASELLRRFPATFELSLTSMLLAVVGGLALGIFSAIHAGKAGDFLAMGLAVCGVSMPIFWLGALLMLGGSLLLPNLTQSLNASLGWFPVLRLPPSGRVSAISDVSYATTFYVLENLVRLRFGALWDSLRHLMLPAVALATIPLSIIARMTRSAVLETLGRDYIRVASAKGLAWQVVVWRHALSNALLPVITVIGLQFGSLLGGAVITEQIFSWPGIGTYLLAAVNARDYRALQGGVLLVAACFVLVNLVADVLYAWANPRIRLS